MTLRVTPFEGEAREWDAAVRSWPGWTHNHLFGWRGIMAEVMGHETIYLAARDAAGVIRGVLPLVRVRSVVFGHYLVSMPFLNYGGPLGDDDAVRALAEHAAALARDGGVKLLELRSRRELPLDLPVSHRKITVVLDLPPGDPDALFASLKGKLRSQVRRPQKEGVSVRFGPDMVDPFFAVFSAHMRDLGTPTQSRRLFEAIARVFPQDSWFGVAWLGDRPVAAGCGFAWSGEFEMIWASSLAEYNRIAPNMALYWAFMERAAREKLGLFNFGRCTPGSGTHRFKQQWGSRDEQLFWYQQAAGGATEAATPSPDQGRWAWGPRIWQRLPLPVANLLGPRIVRLIP